MIVNFSLDVEPVAKGRPRFSGRGGFVRTYTPKKTSAAENMIQLAYMAQKLPKIMDAPISLDLTFWIKQPNGNKKIFPTTRPDIDNYCKLVLDALNGFAWNDDNQIFDLRVAKMYSPIGSKPRIDCGIFYYEEQK